MIIVGFTGTRSGMSHAQRLAVLDALHGLIQIHGLANVKVIHGDCIGADEHFDFIAAQLGIQREIYPCTIEHMRAHCEREGAVCLRLPIAPLKRNEEIVKAVDIMFATPYSPVEEQRSGTWFTIRYARKMNKPLTIF